MRVVVTEAMRLHVQWHWESTSARIIARQLGLAPTTVLSIAYEMGLGTGKPQGMEYVAEAAKRTGFPAKTFDRILRWASVKRIKSRREQATKTKRRAHYVLPETVDAAVAAWLATETITSAAARRGLSRFALEQRLLRHPEAPVKAGRHNWRVPTTLIDEVAAELSGQRLRGPLPSSARRLREIEEAHA